MVTMVKTGDRYGTLVVVSEAPRLPVSRQRRFVCICDCGKEKTLYEQNLMVVKSCGCQKNSYKTVNETGNRYGHVVVTGRAPNDPSKRERSRWFYRCDCGNERIATGTNLRNGNIKSCGCRHGKPKYWAALSQCYNQYKQNARRRGLSFELTTEQFLDITQKDCFYCGTKPSNIYKPTRQTERSGSIPYTYSGIDRVNNSLGYTLGNTVPCCSRCNWSKKDMTQDEFYDWVASVSSHLNLLYKEK